MLIVLIVGLVAAELSWVVAAAVALRTRWLAERLSHRPEELALEWRSGRSWFPGRLRLEGLRIRGQDDRDQWYGEAEEVDIVVRLWPLGRREVVATRTRLRGVEFRLRPRLDRVPADSVKPENLPDIPGYENPPTVAPPPESEPAGGEGPASGRGSGAARHWALRLGGIEVDDLRELWINEGRLRGTGRVRGRVDYQVRGEFRTEVTELDFGGATASMGGHAVGTNLTIRLAGVLGPLRFSECKGAEYFRRIVATAEIEGDVNTASLLARHFGETPEVGVDGAGRMSTRIAVAGGRLKPGTRLDLNSAGLSVQVSQVRIRGAAEVKLRVEAGEDEDAAVSTLRIAVRELGFEHHEEAARAVDTGSLALEAVVYDPSWPDGFRDLTWDLRLGPLRLPDARVLNGFLPDHVEAFAFGRGEFEIGAEYRRSREREGRGRLGVRGSDLAFVLGARDCTGSLEATSDFRTDARRLLTLEPGRVALTNVTMTGVKARQADGWHATVEIPRATMELGGATNLAGEVLVTLLDTRPLIALLRDDEESPGWLRLVPNLKNLRGGARVSVDAEGAVLRDLRLRGAATEILAQLRLREKSTEGILYARYGLISALFDLREGRRDWTIFGAKRGYMKRLAEMKLETDAVPEESAEE